MITGHRLTQLIVATLMLALGFAAHSADKPQEVASDRQAKGETFIGLVENVMSGDQLKMRLTTGETIMVNLAGIKAPADSSPYASVSQQWLGSQLNGQLVTAECEPSDTNHYICAVFPDDRQINLVSLYHGFSVCNGQGSLLHAPDYYKQFEEMAKSNRAGLWQLEDAADDE